MGDQLTAAEADAQMDAQIVEAQNKQEETPGILDETKTEDVEEETVYDGTTGEVKNYQETWTTELITMGLTEKELAELAIDINLADTKLAVQEADLKLVTKEHKKTINATKAELQSMITQVKEGVEISVKCIKKVCFDSNKVTFHDGKGKIYFERVMQDADRQLKLESQVPADSFVNEADSVTASENTQFVEQELTQVDGDEIEKVTERTLTENKPIDL